MSDKKFWFGLITTTVWLVVVALVLLLNAPDLVHMKPNEWGDFFSGMFAPLAFLWLVLGYLQQGQELRVSSNALHLQAEELRNSVEQQRELVEVSRQQVESEREALAYERHRQAEAMKPKFTVVGAGGVFRGDGLSQYTFLLMNVGNVATSVLGNVKLNDGQEFNVVNVPLFERGREQRTSFTLPRAIGETEGVLTVSFEDSMNQLGETQFAVKALKDGPHSELSFIKVQG